MNTACQLYNLAQNEARTLFMASLESKCHPNSQDNDLRSITTMSHNADVCNNSWGFLASRNAFETFENNSQNSGTMHYQFSVLKIDIDNITFLLELT